jgi:antitoxin ParD1/3/4
MNKNMSVTLGDHFSSFIEAQIAQGHFSSTSEVVQAGLRLLEEQEGEVKVALCEALIAGEASGEPRPFDGTAFLERMHDTHAG